LLLVGAPAQTEREDAVAALGRRESSVALQAVHAPSGARVLWGECRAGGTDAGLHTYPDLDVVQLVDPETGEVATEAGEVVLTQVVAADGGLADVGGEPMTGRILVRP